MQGNPHRELRANEPLGETTRMPKVVVESSFIDRLRRFIASGAAPIVALILLPIVLHLPELLGVLHSDALVNTARLSFNSGNIVGHTSTIDPNDGFTKEALGRLAAKMWFSGQIPWWNPYEGIGVPLAGEMQSAAFFPLTLLFIFSQGQLLFQISLQIIAGISTYYLLKEMGLSRNVTFIGAILFEFNGIFVWLTNAAENPVPFLPLLLLGIERAYHATQTRQRHGWRWITIALTFSLLAGFPETAYIDGLLAGVWAIVRFTQGTSWAARLDFARRVSVGFVLGLMIASPLLIAFADYVSVANIGGHSGNFATDALNLFGVTQNFQPYVWGNIFQYTDTATVHLVWGGIGGYESLSLVFLATLGLFGKRERPLRFALLGWIIAVWGKSYGVFPFVALFNLLPLIKEAAFYRYAVASSLIACIILAALALNDLFERAVNWRIIVGSAAGVIAVLGAIPLLLNHAGVSEVIHTTHQRFLFFLASIGLEWGVILMLVGIILFVPQIRRKITLIGVLICCLTVGYFSYPSLANPRHVDLYLGGVTYLQEHAGLQRFYTLGPYTPNYSSYFETASVNDDDLPISAKYADYIHSQLDPYTDPIFFTGNAARTSIDIPDQMSELRRNLANYENTGIKYIVTPPNINPFNQTATIPLAPVGSQAITLQNEAILSGQLGESLTRNEDLASIGVPLTTAVDGMLNLTLCQQNHCADAQATIDPSFSGKTITLTPNAPFTVDDSGTPVTYRLQFESFTEQSLELTRLQVPEAEQQSLQLGTDSLAKSALALTLTHQVQAMATAQPVYKDALMWIYELPNPAPFFDSLGGQCQVEATTWTEAQISCAQNDTLLRRSLSIAGWHVSIDGQEASIEEAQGAFQQVAVPAGTHTLQFWYLPPLAELGIIALIVALLALMLSFVPASAYTQMRERILPPRQAR